MNIQQTNCYNSLIIDTIKEMIELANKGKFTAQQELNGVTVLANGNSNLANLFRDQQRSQSGYIDGPVGPHPKWELTAEEYQNDAKIRAKNEEARLISQQKWQDEQDAKKAKLLAKLADAPGIELTNEPLWRKSKEANQDGYGGGIMSYAEYWARLMQLEIAKGKSLADVAESTSHEADIDGLTGFMYGCAVSQLAGCWNHGDELRRWSNLKHQIKNEGEKANATSGTLNPALLSISTGADKEAE